MLKSFSRTQPAHLCVLLLGVAGVPACVDAGGERHEVSGQTAALTGTTNPVGALLAGAALPSVGALAAVTAVAALQGRDEVVSALVGGASLDVAEFASIARFQKHVGT